MTDQEKHQIYQLRLTRAIAKVQASHKLKKQFKCAVCEIIKLKLAFLYGQQKPYMRKQHIRTLRSNLLEDMGR